MSASGAAAYVGAWAPQPAAYQRGHRHAPEAYIHAPYGAQPYGVHPHHHHHHHPHHPPQYPQYQQPWAQGWPAGMPLMGADPGAMAHGGLNPMAQAAMQYGMQPRAVLVEQRQPGFANREVLPMGSGTQNIPPGFSTQITSRPQRVAFRPERVFVSAFGVALGGGGAADWTINDIKIGNRSQFSQAGDVPGDMFATTSIDSFVTFETAQTAMDVVLIATYNGPIESGIPFYGSIVGTAAV